jgi:hypothetical protein
MGSLIFPQTSVALVLCPEHAQMFAAAGLSKADVQNWMIEKCGHTGREFKLAGKENVPRKPDGTFATDEEFHRILSGPRQVPVIVAGAKNAAISMVVRIFGEWSGSAVPVGEKK